MREREAGMIRRRIEITRERRRRFSFRQSQPLWCAACGRVPELISVCEAADRAGVPSGTVEAAIAAGLLQVWDTGPQRWTCLQCTKNLERNL
jgi:hypothetical protein